MPQLLAILGVVVLGLAGMAVAYVVGWRAKSSRVLRPIVWFSRTLVNPRQMRTAGTPGAYAGIVRHRGRRSGTEYQTPIGIVADGEAFLVALPYGSRTQWVRNVLAAGSATLVHEGRTYAVDRPELVPRVTVASRFSATDQQLFRLLRVDDCLRLHSADHAQVTARAA